MASHNETGKQGELTTVKYLQQLGYIILEQNWRWQKVEIDIIAKDTNELVIIEVKTRNSIQAIDVNELITATKINQLITGADRYATANNISDNIRIDLIVINAFTQEINHYKDAIR